MRLPVDSVDLWEVEADEFFETAGPFYDVFYEGPTLKQSTLDALVEKFVGYFDEQMKMLFEKCVLSNKTVRMVIPEDYTRIFNSTSPIDHAKYYSERKIIEPGREVCFRNEDKEKLDLRVHHSFGGWVMWTWCKPSRLPSS
uniref:mRNA (guanine-N(7))-methyltransferase n=1 Tax=Steinernema glaseri TaxID=37863 RepID=A0A1I7YF54_9BILA